MVVALQRLDEKVVDRKPDGTAPVGIPAEESRRGFRRLVIHAAQLAVGLQRERMLEMIARYRADAVGREKLSLVEQVPQHALQARTRWNGQKHASFGPLLRLHIGDLAGQVPAVLQKPAHA